VQVRQLFEAAPLFESSSITLPLPDLQSSDSKRTEVTSGLTFLGNWRTPRHSVT